MVIDSVIGVEQTAFIASRNILDGPLIVSECISWLEKTKRKAMLFKVDLDKAFDSVIWDCLDDTMVQMNFGETSRKWIRSCLSSASISVLLNGSPTKEFRMKMGVR